MMLVGERRGKNQCRRIGKTTKMPVFSRNNVREGVREEKFNDADGEGSLTKVKGGCCRRCYSVGKEDGNVSCRRGLRAERRSF